MYQHFVDHHLEEEGRDQAKDVEHEGADEDFAQQMPVFFDGGEEPGDVKSFVEVREAGAFCDEDKGAVPDGFELFAGEELGLLGEAVEDERFVVYDAGQDEETGAIATRCNRGERRRFQVGP